MIKTGAAVSEDLDEGYGVEEAIIEANEDDSVHGIMVEPPFFEVYGLTYTCFFKVYFQFFGVQQVFNRGYKQRAQRLAYRYILGSLFAAGIMYPYKLCRIHSDLS